MPVPPTCGTGAEAVLRVPSLIPAAVTARGSRLRPPRSPAPRALVLTTLWFLFDSGIKVTFSQLAVPRKKKRRLFAELQANIRPQKKKKEIMTIMTQWELRGPTCHPELPLLPTSPGGSRGRLPSRPPSPGTRRLSPDFRLNPNFWAEPGFPAASEQPRHQVSHPPRRGDRAWLVPSLLGRSPREELGSPSPRGSAGGAPRQPPDPAASQRSR